jgi:hypothetical protein
MPAAIHRGSVLHGWDHFVITLRDDDGRRSAFLSLYAIAYSASLGAGHVALLRVDEPAGNMNLVLTDAPEVAARMKERLAGMGDTEVDLESAPIPAIFVRQPFGPGGLGFAISWDSHVVDARWIDPAAPFWMIAPAPDLRADEDIWALFVEARRASLTVDGRPVGGGPFQDDVWVPKLGRPLSSAHAALSEVRVTPVSGASGDGAAEE